MKRVLNVAVIEDDEQYKAIYSDLFSKANEKDFDFKVSFFNNGTDFLETYKSDYDFIITDIEMPEVNGLDICKEIREKDKYIPILIVSHSAQYAVTGYKVNAFGYIVKPIIPYDFYFQLNKIKEMPTTSVLMSSFCAVSFYSSNLFFGTRTGRIPFFSLASLN
jgi:DNA-binding response OmpR family regulator